MCLLGIYTIFVKWWDDARLFTPLKKLSNKGIQLISLLFVNTTNDILMLLKNSPVFYLFSVFSGLSLKARDKWTSNGSKTSQS